AGGSVKPVTVSVVVDADREEVYRFLDVLANHERFTDHMLVDWSYSGPPSGVGARARMRVEMAGRPDWLDPAVVAARPPTTNIEESVGAGGRRRTRGIYTLEELPTGGTKITFELAWLQAPLAERLSAPLVRRAVRKGNLRSLQRLADCLAHGSP